MRATVCRRNSSTGAGRRLQRVKLAGWYLVVRQTMWQRILADLRHIQNGRQLDLRHNAARLRRTTRNPVELLDRQLECAVRILFTVMHRHKWINRHHLLHCPLSKGLVVAHDDCPAIILQGRRQNFRRRRADMARQHDHRRIERRPGLNIPPNLDPTLRIFHLHNRTFVDKQAGQRNCLWQRTAGIAPQVENEAVHLFRRQFFSRRSTSRDELFAPAPRFMST